MLKLCCVLLVIVSVARTESVFKICVPHQMFEACQELMNKPTDPVPLQCVSGRDRMDCLAKINLREADFMAVDPEDMYVAYHMKNQDYSVFTEFRTVEEPQMEFRYEGIILVKKNSDIKTLADLNGKKSCHTGFARNVGYKIPITKLIKHGVFKVSQDPSLSQVEKELKGLSELFEKSCLVGKYSPNEETNRILKDKYKNLCSLCEKPSVCDYPDRFSGYDGSIRCLVDNGGDVAFTKVIYVNRHFGLPIGGKPTQATGTGNAADYEYLCEDGTRRPITGQACSWAQRPWQAYMGNADINNKYKTLQQRLQRFYTSAKQSADKKAAEKLWVKDTQTLVDKDNIVYPGEHLIKAQYKDVIERDGVKASTIKLCVTSDEEMKKCDIMKRAAFSRDIRPIFECILKAKKACGLAVASGEADAVVLDGTESSKDLKPILAETYAEDDVHVVIADKGFAQDLVQKAPLNFDESDSRAKDAALFFNNKRNKKVCPDKLSSNAESSMKIVNARNLKNYQNKELVCQDLSRKAVTEFKSCNLEYSIPNKVYVNKNISPDILDNIMHGFVSLSDKFGVDGKIEDVFEMFGQFEEGHKDVIFSDRALKLEKIGSVKGVDETLYKQLHCM